MKVVLSTLFEKDIAEAKVRYDLISPRLADDFYARVKENLCGWQKRSGWLTDSA